VTQLLLSLRRKDLWEILDALQRLCNDPNLLELQEEDGQAFLEVAGYVLLVDVDDDTITMPPVTFSSRGARSSFPRAPAGSAASSGFPVNRYPT
jgi:hypothetical protein